MSASRARAFRSSSSTREPSPRLISTRSCESVAKTGRLLIVEEAFAPFGLGAEIAAGLADEGV